MSVSPGLTNERAYVAHVIDLLAVGLDAYPIVPVDRLQSPHCARVLQAVIDLRDMGHRPNLTSVYFRLQSTGGNMPSEELQAILSAGDGSSSLQDRAQSIETVWRTMEMGRISRRLQEAVQRGETDSAREQASALLTLGGQTAPYTIRTAYESAHRAMEMAVASLDSHAGHVRLADEEITHGIGRLGGGTLTVIGAATGVGKSTLALYLASVASGTVGIVSVEDPPEVYGARILSPHAGVSSSAIFCGDVGNFDTMHKLNDGLGKVGNKPVIAYAIGAPIADVLSACSALVTRHGCRMLIVDYVQAIRVDPRAERRNAIADAVSQIKALASALSVPVIVCSQLSRPPSDAKFREPHTHHLKESGDLENMAEVVLLLWQLSDQPEAHVYGKIAKLKWGIAGHRFRFERDHFGNLIRCIPWAGDNLDKPTPQPQQEARKSWRD